MSRSGLSSKAVRLSAVALVAVLAAALWAYQHAGLAWRVRRHYRIGVDVSHHQGAIDWRRVRADDIAFAYIKATEGATWTDPLFSTNWLEAGREGIPRGAYHFFTFCMPGEEQARHFLDVVPEDPSALPAVVDLEIQGNCSRRPATDELEREVDAFLTLVETTRHCRVIFYVTQDFLEQYGRVTSERELFLRAPGPEPPQLQDREWTYWQFDDDGHVDGISTPVDLDAFAGVAAR